VKEFCLFHFPSESFRIGGVEIGGRVLTAPMTGVSDLPFRRAASMLGAP